MDELQSGERSVRIVTVRPHAVINHVAVPIAGTRVDVDAETAAELIRCGVAVPARTVRVRMLKPDLVNGVWHDAGDVVDVEDDRAGVIVGSGRGELVEGEALGPEGNAKLAEWQARTGAPPPARVHPRRSYIADTAAPVRIRTVQAGVTIGLTTHPRGSAVEVHPDVATRLIGRGLAVLEPGQIFRHSREVQSDLERRGEWHPIT